MGTVSSKLLKRWQTMLNYSICASLIGIGHVAIIYSVKLSGGCNDEVCFNANDPVFITLSDLMSTVSTYITILVLGISGQLAIVLYRLNRLQPEGEEIEDTNITHNWLFSNHGIVTIVMISLFFIMVIFMLAGSGAEHSDSMIKLEFDQTYISRAMFAWIIVLYFTYPFGIGGVFIAILLLLLLKTKQDVRSK